MASASRRQMIIIFGIALVSLGGAYVLFYFAQTGGVWQTINHGDFVEPPTTISDIGWPSDDWREMWWLWVVSTCKVDFLWYSIVKISCPLRPGTM